jgi:AcrR family transcriptional regulator
MSESKDKGRSHKPPNLPSERPGPAGGKRDANRRKKVQVICEAGLALFCEQGANAVTVDEIVARAKIPKGSFYRYFSGKEELVETLFDPLATELRSIVGLTEQALTDTDSPAALNRVYVELAALLTRLLASNLDLLRLYLQENRGPNVGARRPILKLAGEVDEIAFSLSRIARAHGLLRSDYDLKVGALTSLGAVERLIFSYVRGDSMAEPAAVSADLIRVILDGVRA